MRKWIICWYLIGCVTIGFGQTLTMSFPDTSVFQQQIIKLPLLVEDFTRIVSIEFTMSWDPNVLRYIGSEEADLFGAAVGDTRSADGILRFSWFSITQDFVTLPDGSAIIEMEFITIGDIGDQTDLSIDDLPFQPIEIAQATSTPDEVILLSLTDEVGTVSIIETPEFVVSVEEKGTSCADSADGSIQIDVQGATTLIRFEWEGPNGFTSDEEDLTNLLGGLYRLAIFDSRQRIIFQENIIVEAPEVPLAIGDVAIQSYDCDLALAEVSVNANGGVAPYLYRIGNNSQTSPIFRSLPGNDYVVVVTDANGCSISSNFNIPVSSAPTIRDISIGNYNCQSGRSNATVEAQGGVTPLRYNIGRGNQVNPTFQSLNPGNYTVTVTDDIGCNTLESFNIPAFESLSFDGTDILNYNCNNGRSSIRINITGGRSPFLYSLGPNNNQNTPTFLNLNPGSYQLRVTDANNCTILEPISIPEVSPINIGAIIIDDYDCSAGQADVLINVAGGDPPYNFNIGSGNQTNPSFTNLPAGNYAVTVTDALDCSVVDEFNIPVPNPPRVIGVEIDNFNCSNGRSNATIQVVSGQTPYRYNVGNGRQSSPTFNGLSPATYSVTITDANNCEEVQEFTIPSVERLTIMGVTLEDLNCNNGRSDARISTEGGIPPYRYTIGNVSQISPIFPNLPPNQYNVTVVDGNNCQASRQFIIEERIPISVLEPELVVEDCNIGGIGVILNASGGNSPYNYKIGDIEQSNPRFNDLPAGNYSFSISDADDCEATGVFAIPNTSVLSLENILVEKTSCISGRGKATVQIKGGIQPYQFDIGNGPQSSPNFEDLLPGNYNLTAEDSKGCRVLQNFRIEEISDLQIDSLTTSFTNCETGLATATIYISEGRSPYLFNYGTGSSNERTLRNLTPGNYAVTIADSEGCSGIANFQIDEPSIIQIDGIDIRLEDCSNNTSSVNIDFSNGIAPFSFNIGTENTDVLPFSGVGPGTYLATVIDAANCRDTTTFTIEEKPGLNAILGERIDACIGETVILDPGNFAQYSWSNGATSPTIDVNVQGRYAVTVSDGEGCFAEDEVEVVFSSPLNLSFDQSDLIACPGAPVAFFATGAEVYEWIDTSSTLNDTTSANPIARPFYFTTYTLIASNSCDSDTIDFNIDIIDVDISVGPADTCIGIGTELELFASGGLSYEWQASPYPVSNAFIPNPIVSPEETTTYYVSIEDQTGCTVTDSVIVEVANQPDNLDLSNLITPNGDGKNDELVFQNIIKYGQNSLRIFNRWGDIVYEKVNYMLDDERFDGTKNGKPLPVGNYYYVLSFRNIQFRQTLTVLRE